MTTTNQFETLLKEFSVLVSENADGKKEVPKTIESIEKIKEKAKLGAGLNGRQMEAIIARCNRFIDGSYGNTKKDVKINEPRGK